MLQIAGIPTEYYLNENNKFNPDFVFIPEKIKKFITKLFGYFGLILFYIPLYYTVIIPVFLILFNIIYKTNKKHFKNIIQDFKKLPEKEKQKVLSRIQKINSVYFIFSKKLRQNKSKIYKTKILHKSFQKVKQIFSDIEQEMHFHLKENEKYSVPEISDKELIEMLNSNRKLLKTFFTEEQFV